MRRNRALLFAIVALGVLYAGLMIALPPGAFFSGDEGVKWLQIDSLWRHKWTTLAIEPPGAALDPDAEFIPAFLVKVGGVVRSVFPATLPLIASLPYALAGSRGIYLVPALAALLCAAAAARLGRFVLPPGWAGIAGAAAVAATPLVFYGATIWEHTLAAALCTAAMIPLSKSLEAEAGQGALRLGAAAGLLIGLAAGARKECAMMIPAVVVAGAIAWGPGVFAPRAAGAIAASALILVPQALYHRARFGSWLPPHLQANLPGGALGRAGRPPWSVAGEMIGPEGPRWLFTLAVAACALLWLAARARRPRGEGGTYPSVMVWTGLALSAALAAAGPLRTLILEFSPLSLSTRDRGYHALLHTMPIVALLPLAMFLPPAPRRPHVTFFSWTAGLFVAITAATSPVPGGLQWGPRLLLPVAPLIVLALAASVVGRRRAAGARSAFAALVLALALGLVMQGVGLRFLVAVRTYNAGMLERVRRTVPAGDAILSDFFAVPQLLASLSPVTPVLYVKPDADLEALSSRFDAANVTPYWIMKDKPAGGNAVDLGAGLSLVRYEREAGVRGFLRPPRGD